MPQQSPFAPAISGLVGQRRRIGSIATPSMGEGQFYEDPSITAHGLLKQQEDEIQNRSYAETDPAALQRLARILQGNQVDLSENEASMQNPEMEAGYTANEAARRVGFPSSAAAGDYTRNFEREKSQVPVEAARVAGQLDIEQEQEKGHQTRELQRLLDWNLQGREQKYYDQASKLQSGMGTPGGPGSQAITRMAPPSQKSSGSISLSAPQRPQNTVQLQRDYALAQKAFADNPNDEANIAGVQYTMQNYVNGFNAPDSAKQAALQIMNNPNLKDLPFEEIVDLDNPDMDPAELLGLASLLRGLRGF